MQNKNISAGPKQNAPARLKLQLMTHHIYLCASFAPALKSNALNRSSIAGLLVGTYGFSFVAFGFGRLSRLRAVSGDSLKFRSINFVMETWSP